MESELLVPHYLKKGQNITDQPPFDWLEVEDIFPPDYFLENSSGFKFLIRLVAIYFPYLESASIWKNTIAKISPEYQKKYKIHFKAEKLIERMESYPQLRSYIKEHWKVAGKSNFDENGDPTNIEEILPTYAGYASAMLGLRWIGLDEVLPDASAAPEIIAALSAKPNINKLYRIIKSEALK